MTDSAFVLAILNDGAWHSQPDVLAASIAERGCGLTLHSRVSELRTKHGYDIRQRSERRNGRVVSFYRLVTEALGEPESATTTDATADPDNAAGDPTFGDPAITSETEGTESGSPSASQLSLIGSPGRGAYSEPEAA